MRASIFYVDQGGNIINALFNCNVSTGLFYGQGNWIISDQAPSIHSNTGLAAVVLGAEAGYRVYYHDEDGAVNELKYTPADDWHYEGVISNDINSLPALAATFTGRENISIASPRDDENIAVTRWTREETWYRCTLLHSRFFGARRSDTHRQQQPCRGPSSVTSPRRRLTGTTSLSTRRLRPTSLFLPGMARQRALASASTGD